MTNKEMFINEILNFISKENGLSFSNEALKFFNELQNEKSNNRTLTEIGEKILIWVKNSTSKNNVMFSCRTIGEGLFLSPRIISGAVRKLINDGYLHKEGKNPVLYGITKEGYVVLDKSK